MFSPNEKHTQNLIQDTNLPFVSVVMPVRNEEKYIQGSLNSVLNQDYPQSQMEIFVIDGISDDKTCEIVANYQKGHSNIKIIKNPRKIVPTGLNLAIKEAKGTIIVRVDGHCEIEKSYIRNCVLHLQNPSIWAVGGPMHTIGETFTAKAIAIGMSSKLGVGGSSFRTEKDEKRFVETVPFPAYRKETLDAMGPFDEELVRNQDDEYNYRVSKHGGKILLSPDIQSVYYSRGTLKKLWKQYFQYGYWKVRVFQKHPKQMRSRQFVPALFIAALFISIIFGIVFPNLFYLYGFIPLIYTLFIIAASLRTSQVHGFEYFFIMLIIFPFLHLSYGLGFWVGIFMFSNRWGKPAAE